MKKRLIKFGDVTFDREAKLHVNEILATGKNTEGKYVEKFEKAFAEKFGFEYAIATSSGTTANEVVWMAIANSLGLRWSEGVVITPVLAFGSTANSILRAGRSLQFIDIASDLNMQVPISYKSMSFGVQFVLTMGRTSGLKEIRQFTSRHGLFLVLDACEGLGASYYDNGIATYCDAATYSFYPAHISTVGGEAGIIATNNAALALLCRSIKSHGRPAGSIEHRFQHIGTNAKTTEIVAACGLAALKKHDKVFARRRKIRNGLLERLTEFPVMLFPDAENETIAPHAFPIVTSARSFARFKEHLENWQIEFKPLWGALTDHPAFAEFKAPADRFPVADTIGSGGLHFGCHEGMSDDDLDYIHDVFKAFRWGLTW